jgi:hypothetical protein
METIYNTTVPQGVSRNYLSDANTLAEWSRIGGRSGKRKSIFTGVPKTPPNQPPNQRALILNLGPKLMHSGDPKFMPMRVGSQINSLCSCAGSARQDPIGSTGTSRHVGKKPMALGRANPSLNPTLARLPPSGATVAANKAPLPSSPPAPPAKKSRCVCRMRNPAVVWQGFRNLCSR